MKNAINKPRNPKYYRHEKANKVLNTAYWVLLGGMVASWGILFLLP